MSGFAHNDRRKGQVVGRNRLNPNLTPYVEASAFGYELPSVAVESFFIPTKREVVGAVLRVCNCILSEKMVQ